MSSINTKIKNVTKSIDAQCISSIDKTNLQGLIKTATKLEEDNRNMLTKITEIHEKIPSRDKSSKGGKSKKQKRKIIFRKRRTIRRRRKF